LRAHEQQHDPRDFRRVTLKAGTWFSNDESRRSSLSRTSRTISLTFTPFSNWLTSGAIAKRRLTPIVDWNAVEKIAKEL
jgi:hypothetical protein